MRDLRSLNSLIDRIRNDYEFNSNEEYIGYLNIDPSQEWTVQEWDDMLYMIENEPDLLDDILEMRGLELQSFGPNEVIFILLEEPFGNLYQGRTPKQVEYSSLVVNGIISIAIIVSVAVVIYSFLSL